MFSKAFLTAILMAMVVAPSLATDYIVGDDAGWKVGVNYTEWAAGKNFHVGDKLMFMYKAGSHNVLKVNETDFQQCRPNSTAALVSGIDHDLVKLANPGKKWYICGFADHCSKGMKLVINVLEAEAEAPAPIPTLTPGSSGAIEISPFKSFVWVIAALAVFKIILA